eukprot:COSAG02_NODE_5453_length_4304_cov_2.319382_3_plen_56_part_00
MEFLPQMQSIIVVYRVARLDLLWQLGVNYPAATLKSTRTYRKQPLNVPMVAFEFA